MSSASMLTLTPEPHPGSGVGASTEPTPATDAYLARAGEGYDAWLSHVWPAAGCQRPVQLRGDLATVDTRSGQLLDSRHTSTLPDGVIYKACGNRRHTVCPSCAERYRQDAYQLIRAGLVGGKTIDESVATHSAVFATFTAPSFGAVHTRVVKHHTCESRKRCRCRSEPCRARRDATTCEHGRLTSCSQRHGVDDMALGHPLCLDCYDHDAQVVWNNHAGELWRRTVQALTRSLVHVSRQRGVGFLDVETGPGEHRSLSTLRIRYAKVAEYQTRGVIHFHVLFRLDGVDPYHPDQVTPPDPAADVDLLTDVIQLAATTTRFRTPAHPTYRPEGWPIGWGEQLDLRPVLLRGDNSVTDSQVAGYLAKYATKSTETTGHVSTRLTSETINTYADPTGSHPERLIEACWRLSRHAHWHSLGKWAHMLGYGGHFLTKARAYSVSFGYLRSLRVTWRRSQTPDTTVEVRAIDDRDDDTVIVSNLTYAGIGWHTTADATLANTAAALARLRAQTARDSVHEHLDLTTVAV
ncbi:MAG: plasmid replication initiator protein [Streptosporangiales bacterium]|nr:plasmid replication initiator protein [Streptosporangiales bacterium]